MITASRILTVLVCCLPLRAAVLRGIVVDNYTGRPLARAVVALLSVEGYTPVNFSVRTDRGGVFTFPPVGAGAYLMNASRPGFATLKYGQKAWNAPGAPIFLQADDSTFLQLRLQRLGAIAGTVWDENEIGFPEQDVVIYRATRPPKLVHKTKTDDRGMFRFGLLFPGRYLIRTLAHAIDDETTMLPTFYKEVGPVDDAAAVQVGLEEQATEINFKPLFGRLVKLTGFAIPPPQTLVLVSDMGEEPGGADAAGRFEFANLAPGRYEIFATLQTGPNNRYAYGAYQELALDKDTEIRLPLQQAPTMDISYEEQSGGRIDPSQISVFARRLTLAGSGQSLRLKDRADIMPGRWELAVSRPSTLYPVSILVNAHEIAPGGRAAGWHEFLASQGRLVQTRIRFSSRPAGVHGKVTGPGNDPVVGAPVYLEPIDAESHRRVGDLASTRTDARGQYRFVGMPPGSYRLLSTFDIEDPEEDVMDAARARLTVLKESSAAVEDLELYIR